MTHKLVSLDKLIELKKKFASTPSMTLEQFTHERICIFLNAPEVDLSEETIKNESEIYPEKSIEAKYYEKGYQQAIKDLPI